jgi:hypothetical protein
MTADRAADAGDPWAAAAHALAPLLGAGAPFELRFGLRAEAAVRVLAPRGPVAPRHAEAPDVTAPWSARAHCGDACGWLLAAAGPSDPDRARALLARATERHAALRLQHLATQTAALTYDVLESITHRMRTDVSTLQAVGEGALADVFEAAEIDDVAREVRAVGEESQRRLTEVREVMAVLEPEARRCPEPLVQRLRDALGTTGTPIADPAGEEAHALIPGPGWSAGAAALARALRDDRRLGLENGQLTISAHPDGWLLIAGAPGTDGDPVPWTYQHLGPLAHGGHLVAAAGGSVAARRIDGDALRVAWTVPAAPSA